MAQSRKKKTSRSRSKGHNKMWLVAAGVILIAAAGLLAWRSFQSGSTSTAVTLSDAAGTQLGQIAPDFTVPTLDGGAFTLADQRGKPAIIYFMAYWCGTCIPEAQALAQLQKEYGDAVSIVVIDIDPSSTPDALANFKQAANDGNYVWAFDAGQAVTNAWQVQALDTTLILDSAGHVIYRDAAPTPYQTLKQTLTELGL